jgi:uncharacterized RDD family membrane protein YckC
LLDVQLKEQKIDQKTYNKHMFWLAVDARGGITSIVLDFLLQTLVIVIYFIVAAKYAWPSIGKRVLKLDILDEKTMQRPSVKQMFGRYCAMMLSITPLCLGFIWGRFDPKRRTWHDKLAHTVVVNRRAFNPDWEKKKFKLQTIAFVIIILLIIAYHRTQNQ